MTEVGKHNALSGNTTTGSWIESLKFRLTAASGASTYPANRDFKGHVGGVRGAAPQGFFLFFSIFFEFFCQIFKEKKGDVLTNI